MTNDPILCNNLNPYYFTTKSFFNDFDELKNTHLKALKY